MRAGLRGLTTRGKSFLAAAIAVALVALVLGEKDLLRLAILLAALPLLAAWYVGGAKASWLWLFAFFVIITVGELYLSPTSLSLVTKAAPVRVLSLMMGVWLATSFVGNFLAGYLGTFWSRLDRVPFFLMLALIAAAAGAVIALLDRPLRRVLRD